MNRLKLGGVLLTDLARDPAIGTPSYVYDLSAIASEARALVQAFDGAPHLVAYAVKANSAGPIVRTLVKESVGADVVSGAELSLALRCGIGPDSIVFSGVAKSDAEIDAAISAGPRGILAIQVESLEELARVEARACALGRMARVSFRVNPAVEKAALATHAHIATGHDEAKFGIPKDDVGTALASLREATHLSLVGFTVHVGSQFTTVEAYVAAAGSLFDIVHHARAKHGSALEFIDAGGGFGVDYGEGCSARPCDFVRAVQNEQRAAGLSDLRLVVEPGRSLVAKHGVLIARVLQSKASRTNPALRWMMIDAGMNDLIRPALYQARHRIVPLEERANDAERVAVRVVGPVCESADDFGTHDLPIDTPREVAILDAGAYGYTMASRYNGRALPAEVFVEDRRVVFVRAREEAESWVGDRLMPRGS